MLKIIIFTIPTVKNKNIISCIKKNVNNQRFAHNFRYIYWQVKNNNTESDKKQIKSVCADKKSCATLTCTKIETEESSSAQVNSVWKFRRVRTRPEHSTLPTFSIAIPEHRSKVILGHESSVGYHRVCHGTDGSITSNKGQHKPKSHHFRYYETQNKVSRHTFHLPFPFGIQMLFCCGGKKGEWLAAGWEKASEKGFDSWRRSSDAFGSGGSVSIAKRSTAGVDVACEDTVVEEEELLRNGLFAVGGDTFACSQTQCFWYSFHDFLITAEHIHCK